MVGFEGPKFTWLYQKQEGTQIREHLDRALASTDWHSSFPYAKLHHKSSSVSDHNPLLLHLFSKKKHQKYKKIFRFESLWLKDEGCEKVVTEAWGEGLCMASDFPILSCMESCQNKLEVWNTTEYGHVGKKIAFLQKRLEGLEVQASSLAIIKIGRAHV